MSIKYKFPAFLLATLIATPAWADEPRAASARPETLAGAVSLIVGQLNANQKQIIRGTAKDNLLVALAEWAGDVQDDLGLQRGSSINTKLIADACQRTCTPDQATARVMEAVWEALQH